MKITVIDRNGQTHTVQTHSIDVTENEVMCKDGIGRIKAVFQKQHIIGFITDRN